MINAGCGYLADEYEQFCNLLLEINSRYDYHVITINDILNVTDKGNALKLIVDSGARGTPETLELFSLFLTSQCNEFDKTEMVKQMNRYITSSQDLSQAGRIQFTSLYSVHDVISVFGAIFINKCCYANYDSFSSAYVFMFNSASLESFLTDVQNDFCDTKYFI